MPHRYLSLLAVALILAPVARAQDVPQEADRLLRPDVQALVVDHDVVSHVETRLGVDGRYDVETGVRRAAYRIDAEGAPGAAPEAAARAVLASAAEEFGWAPEADDLALVDVVEGRRSSHVRFQQMYQGQPVHRREVKVNLDREGRPTMILSGYAPQLRSRGFDASPRISASQAASTVAGLGREGPLTVRTEPVLVVVPMETPLLAWRLRAGAEAPFSEWEVLLDAHSGEVIQILDLAAHSASGVSGSGFRVPGFGFQDSGSGSEAKTLVDGTGWVFDPDPLTTAGAEYGGTYADFDDADAAWLDAELIEVPLRDITLGDDGRYRLEGPYVRIEGSASYVPAEEQPVFHYTRADDRFEAVMAYYHIDKSARYVDEIMASSGLLPPIESIRVDPHGLNTDNSLYSGGRIRFGDGGVDDAEDADVLWHEYAHSLLDQAVPGLLGYREGQALHEGWADYWAASYARSLVEADPSIPADDWRHLYTWDGNNGTWCGRDLIHDGRYPDRMTHAPPPGCSVPEKYQEGLLWATTLMEVYDRVGREVLDPLNLISHSYLSATATFADAAHALVLADLDYYDGAHSDILIDVLSRRGFIADPAEYGPVLAHEPLPDTEESGGTVVLSVDVVGGAAEIDSVIVHYQLNGGEEGHLLLQEMGGERYEASLPLPAAADTVGVAYFIEAVDVLRQRTRLPAGAPAETYHFTVGMDRIPPEIRHDPQASIPLAGWPLRLEADVSDNIGVDSVWVDYVIESPDGLRHQEGTFSLLTSGGAYEGVVPVDASQLQEGDVIEYRIRARDVAAMNNEARYPQEGMIKLRIVAKGPLRVFDFDQAEQSLHADGDWALGIPAYGVHVPHSGSQVWATHPDGSYPAFSSLSSLQLPPFDLEGIGDVYLVFWHWYDFEHGGQVVPDRFSEGAALWDGGNVKLSTDGGRTWTVLLPEQGYNGTVADNTSNPLKGQRAFGGYSYGWRQVVVPLPSTEDVRIRFDVGTDESNQAHSHPCDASGEPCYAGWYLDDVEITTKYPEDLAAPEVVERPEAAQVRYVGQAAPRIELRATDDVGIEAVVASVKVETKQGVREDTVRLSMSPHDGSLFSAAVTADAAFGAGDRIAYRLLVRDFAGNEIELPDAGEEPFTVTYHIRKSLDALEDVRASGAWTRQEGFWQVGQDGTSLRSSLVLAPLDLPTNGAALTFSMQHQYDLGEGVAGNVKVTDDDGGTWRVLEPVDGYPDVFAPSKEHPMSGEATFGSSSGLLTSRFDLAPYAGRQVRIRIDMAATRPMVDDEAWKIFVGSVQLSTPESTFEVPRSLALHANFPDPFPQSTTISYTIPERRPVRLSVYDMLGRRVALLVHEEQPAGTYTLPFDGSRLSSGVYMLHLEAGDQRRVERMVVAR